MHTDPDIWNSMDGTHPVNSFWAERFIVYRKDPQSGPVNPKSSKLAVVKKTDAEKPYFTTDGLYGAFIPYGGMLIG